MIRLVTLLLSFSLTITGMAQTGKADTVEIQVRAIRRAFADINRHLHQYKATSDSLEDRSAEGGTFTRYRHGDTLKKAVAQFYGETGQTTIEYYFNKSQLIFVYEKRLRYEKPIYMGKLKIISTEEHRYYFAGPNLIRWLKGKTAITDAPTLTQKSKEIHDDLHAYALH